MRPKSKKQISLWFRFKRFSFLLILAFAIGFGSKQFFQASFIRDKITNLVESSKLPVKIEFEQARLSLADGWRPHISVRLSQVVVSDLKCEREIFKSPDLFVTLNLKALFQGALKLHRGIIREGVLRAEHLNIGHCEPAQEQKNESDVKATVDTTGDDVLKSALDKTFSAKAENHLKEKINSAVKKINWQANFPKLMDFLGKRKPVNFIQFEDLIVILKEDLENSQELISDLDFDFSDMNQMKLSGEVKKIIIKNKVYDKFKIDVEAVLNNKGLGLDIISRLREGHWSFNFFITDRGALSLNSIADKVPLSQLKDAGWASSDFTLHFLWFECSLHYKGELEQWSQSPLEVKVCKFTGPHGEMIIQEGNLNLWDHGAVEADLKGLQLDQIFVTRRDLFLSGIFNRYGDITGKLKYKFDEGLSFEGDLENSSVIFSRAGSRVAQDLNFRIKLHYQNRLSILVDRAKIQQGKFRGQLSLSYNPQDGSGVGQIAIHSLEFKPEVFKMLLNAKVEPLAAYGKIFWENKSFKSWDGYFLTTGVSNEGFSMSNIKAQSEYVNDEFDIKLNLARADIRPESDLYAWVKPLFLSEKIPNLKINEGSVRIAIKRDEVAWNSGFLSLVDGGTIVTEGKNKDKKFDFNLYYHARNKTDYKWRIKGPYRSMTWEPLREEMITWIEANPSFQETFPNVLLSKKKEE